MNEEYFKEIEAFTKSEREFTLSNGQTIKIKPLTWGQELKIIKILGELLNKTTQNTSVVVESLGEIELGSSIGALLEESPEAITKICAIITGLTTEEIETNFVFEDIVEICFPFLASLVRRLQMKVVEKVETFFQKKEKPKKKKGQ